MSCYQIFLCNRTFAPSWWEAHLEHSEFPGFPCSSIFISFYFHSCPFNSFHFISSFSQFLSFSFSSFPVPSYPFMSCHFLSFPFCFLSIRFISYSFPFVSNPFISFPFTSCSFPIISLRVLALPFCTPCEKLCSYELLPRTFEPETLWSYLNFKDFPVTLSNRTLSPSWWEAHLEHLDLLRFPCCWL